MGHGWSKRFKKFQWKYSNGSQNTNTQLVSRKIGPCFTLCHLFALAPHSRARFPSCVSKWNDLSHRSQAGTTKGSQHLSEDLFSRPLRELEPVIHTLGGFFPSPNSPFILTSSVKLCNQHSWFLFLILRKLFLELTRAENPVRRRECPHDAVALQTELHSESLTIYFLLLQLHFYFYDLKMLCSTINIFWNQHFYTLSCTVTQDK